MNKNKETEIKALQVSQENKEEQTSRVEEQIKKIKDIVEGIKFEINDCPQS